MDALAGFVYLVISFPFLEIVLRGSSGDRSCKSLPADGCVPIAGQKRSAKKEQERKAVLSEQGISEKSVVRDSVW